jgi:hypothetical protein
MTNTHRFAWRCCLGVWVKTRRSRHLVLARREGDGRNSIQQTTDADERTSRWSRLRNRMPQDAHARRHLVAGPSAEQHADNDRGRMAVKGSVSSCMRLRVVLQQSTTCMSTRPGIRQIKADSRKFKKECKGLSLGSSCFPLSRSRRSVVVLARHRPVSMRRLHSTPHSIRPKWEDDDATLLLFAYSIASFRLIVHRNPLEGANSIIPSPHPDRHGPHPRPIVYRNPLDSANSIMPLPHPDRHGPHLRMLPRRTTSATSQTLSKSDRRRPGYREAWANSASTCSTLAASTASPEVNTLFRRRYERDEVVGRRPAFHDCEEAV